MTEFDGAPKVIFSHGKESGPWGTKIQRLAKVAESLGFSVESVDYTGLDDPGARVEKLLQQLDATPPQLLVGSSMGGYVSAAAATKIPTRALFLMAPAVFVPGYDDTEIRDLACPITVVHGWRDDVIPVECAWRFSMLHGATLHVLDDDHRLVGSLDFVEKLFTDFLGST
ncbi:MAG: YqiA/YcfP family alpha/beta fold hydrolase [Pseudomonadota bacterium]